MIEEDILATEVDNLRFEVGCLLQTLNDHEKSIERFEKTINTLLDELPYNTALATELARSEFSK